MKSFNDLKKNIIDCDLCTGCGTCIGICPTETLSSLDGKVINSKNNCVSCGMCNKVCPGKFFSWKEWSLKIYGEEDHSNSVLGIYQNIFNSRSRDPHISHAAASGGVVTQLLIDLLESHTIGGAVVIGNKGNSSYKFEAIIATKKEQIIGSAQSKYMIIPVNQILRKIKEQDKQIAFVGLPCQIHGVRKAMEIDTELQQKIVILISLFCGFNMESAATDYLIAKSRIKKDNITKLQYRRKVADQSGFYVEEKSGQNFFVDKHGYTFLNIIFSPKRCWKCYDYSGEFADISVGDAWDKEHGWSRVIIRTSIGKTLFDQSVTKGTLLSEEADIHKIFFTQNKVISYKKRQISIRKKLMKTFPEYEISFPRLNVIEAAKGTILFLMLELFKTKLGKGLVHILPFQLMTRISSKLKGNEINK